MALIMKKWDIHGGNYMLSRGLLEAWDIKNFWDLNPMRSSNPQAII